MRRFFDLSLIIALGALLTLLLFAWWLPEAAHADDVTDTPTVTAGLRNPDGTTPHVVRLQATDRTWRIRMAARAWDDAVPGLDISQGPCVPELPCIRVHVGTWTPEAALEVSQGGTRYWSGLCVYTSDSIRDVYLNRARVHAGRTRVASHEFAHALGLAHHHGVGILGDSNIKSWLWRPLDAEADALARYYSGPYA